MRCPPYLVLHLLAAVSEEAEINHPLCIQQNIIVDDWSWASTLFAFSLLVLFSLLLVVLTSLQQSWLLLHTMMCILLFMQSAISLGEDRVVKLLIINIPIFFPGENWKRLWRDLLEEAAKTTLTSSFKGLPCDTVVDFSYVLFLEKRHEMSHPILKYLYIREVYIILLFVPLSSLAESLLMMSFSQLQGSSQFCPESFICKHFFCARLDGYAGGGSTALSACLADSWIPLCWQICLLSFSCFSSWPPLLHSVVSGCSCPSVRALRMHDVVLKQMLHLTKPDISSVFLWRGNQGPALSLCVGYLLRSCI